MKVTLGKSIRIPGGPLRRSGSVIDVTDDEKAWLESVGVLAALPKKNVTVTKSPVVEVPTKKATKPEIARPPKSASSEKWAEYLTAKGVDPKGLSKREMIAAA